MPRRRTPKPEANTLPGRFQPYLWERNADGRSVVARELKKRFKLLCEHSGANCIQRTMLCQRIAFLSIQIETQELKAAHSKEFDAGTYGMLLNTFHGLLKALGLDLNRKTKSILNYHRDDDDETE